MSGGGSLSAMRRRGRPAAAAVLLAGACLLAASPARGGAGRAGGGAAFRGAAADVRLAMGKKGGVSVDPVCGMEVDEAGARARGNATDRGGRSYFFCNPGCKAAFDRDPGAYAPHGGNAGAAVVAVDPVCGMEVDEAAAKARGWTAGHGGKAFFFCNPACRDAFATDPAAYLRNGKGGGGVPEGHGAGGR